MEKNEAPIQFPAMFTKKEYGFSLVIFSSSFLDSQYHNFQYFFISVETYIPYQD